MSWQPGRDQITRLIAASELDQVTADQTIALRLLDDARRHLNSASAAAEIGDLTGAYQLTYDAFRKSAASLLAAQGLRATSRGGHVAVQDAVTAQFGFQRPSIPGVQPDSARPQQLRVPRHRYRRANL